MILVDMGLEIVEMTDEEYARHLAQIAALQAEYWTEFRKERNRRLSESDWVMMPDATVVNKQDWLDYRQALRDLPASTENPRQPNWPVAPT